MSNSDTSDFVVAIGGSAGGFQAVELLLAELPRNLDAPVVIALHGSSESNLAQVLGVKKSLDIRALEPDVPLERGVIYIVPGARHAMFVNDVMHLSDHVSDSGFRPSIDALFMTLAAQYGKRAIGVVLSGMLKDGMRGAQVIYDMGGRTIVQNPTEAIYKSMPQSVINADHPRAILTAGELGEWLIREVGLVPEQP